MNEPGVSRAEQLCWRAVAELAVDGAGLSMMTPAGHRGTVCATDDVARQVEDQQFALGEGPCFDAFNAAGPVLIPDINAPANRALTRWPMFTEAVAAAGVRALFAFPLLIGAIPLGALDLYRARPQGLTPEELQKAWKIADAAADALLDLRSGNAMDLPADVAPAGASYRLEVHQATGMLSVQLGLALEAAFLRLRAHAFAHALDLADVARDVIAGRLQLLTEED